MKYWPLSSIAPHVPSPYLAEIMRGCAGLPVSHDAVRACSVAIQHVAPVSAPNTVYVLSVNAPARRVFLRHPGPEEWEALERVGITDDGGMLAMIVDALH